MAARESLGLAALAVAGVMSISCSSAERAPLRGFDKPTSSSCSQATQAVLRDLHHLSAGIPSAAMKHRPVERLVVYVDPALDHISPEEVLHAAVQEVRTWKGASANLDVLLLETTQTLHDSGCARTASVAWWKLALAGGVRVVAAVHDWTPNGKDPVGSPYLWVDRHARAITDHSLDLSEPSGGFGYGWVKPDGIDGIFVFNRDEADPPRK